MDTDSTTTITPLELATQVAEAMRPWGGEWTARQRDYRATDTAEIVNEHGDAIFMTIMGRDAYTRANERGKVHFRGSPDPELREHYAYRTERPETMVTATRGPAAMAKAVVSKIVPTLIENNRVARVRRAEFEAGREESRAVAVRLAEAAGDTRAAAIYAADTDGPDGGRRDGDRFRFGPIDTDVEVHGGGRVYELKFRDIPAEMAERFLREVRAYRDAQRDDT